MLFFKTRTALNKNDKVQDKVAKAVATCLLSVQKKFASFMNSTTNRLTETTKQIYLYLFCLVSGGISIYACMGILGDTHNASKSIKPAQVSVPKYYDRTGTVIKKPVVSDKEMMRIKSFRSYMDGLNQSVKGKMIYDSILNSRPGLMDSITAIEKIHYLQSK